MKESLPNIPDPLDIVYLSYERKDFAGDITGLYNTMFLFNPNEGVVSLGKLHGFELTYGGFILSVGSLEMDEESAKKLRDYLLGENFTGDAFGNPIGIPEQIWIKDEERIQEMWAVSVDFINWPDHFVNTPDAVFECLEQLAKDLRTYRRKSGGFEDLEDDGFRTVEGETERLRIDLHFNRIGKDTEDNFTEEGEEDEGDEEDTPLPDKKASEQQVTKPHKRFGNFINRFRRKTSL